MEILIKNMEMPENCEDCFACEKCYYESFDYCNVLKDMTTRGERRNDCPLVALPEHHGRLGDLDALQKQIEDDIETVAKEKGKVGLRELWQILNKNIENAPVIVEATE